MTPSTHSFSRFLAAYGMVFVLALLCAFFSFATYTEQHPTGADAARQLANSLLSQFGKSARVLIAVPNQPDADAFAKVLPLLRRVETLAMSANYIGTRGFAALAAAIREGAAPALKEFDFRTNNDHGDSTALKEACEARGIRTRSQRDVS